MFPADSRFLAVDDSTFTLYMVRKALSDMGFSDVLEATNVKSAQHHLVQQVKSRKPIHCVILDVNMPGDSGLKLVEWIRSRDFLVNLPILLLTSNRERDDVIEAAKLGVSQYCTKPFDTLTLKKHLQGTWERHGKKFFENLEKERAG